MVVLHIHWNIVKYYSKKKKNYSYVYCLVYVALRRAVTIFCIRNIEENYLILDNCREAGLFVVTFALLQRQSIDSQVLTNP